MPSQFSKTLWLLLLINVLGGIVSAEESEPSEEMFQPLAPNFWLPLDQADKNPPEKLLWPDGTPNIRPLKQEEEPGDKGRLDRRIRNVGEPTIAIHRPDGDQKAKSAVVICPGGGYSGLSIDKEGHDTARWFNSLGMTAIVLKYRLKEYGQPAPGNDAQRAIAVVRSRAEELELDADRIGILGYSAGGHVASTAGTRFRDIEIKGKQISSRPDFMILVYPVISMDEKIAHRGSRDNLLGPNPNSALIEEYSNEKQVSAETPPTFLVHSTDDAVVPADNCLRMKRAIEAAGIEVELALYDQGGHGFGLVEEPIPAAEWPLRCEKWLRKQGFLKQTPSESDDS